MGGSSSRQVQEVKYPDWYEDAAREAIKRSREAAAVGRLPYTGIDVAAINPAEAAAARNVAAMASAFGLEAPAEIDMGGMPTVTTGGMTGYSSYPMFTADMQRLKEQRPDQYEYFAKMTGFDPITGAAVAPPPAPVAAPVAAPVSSVGSGSDESTADALERHYSIFPEARPRSLTYSSTGSAPTIRPPSSADVAISSAFNKSPIGKLFGAITNRA